MNALTTFSFAKAAPASRVALLNALSRPAPRERDFGVGYGNSSGYASNRRYTNEWAPPRFRFA